MCLFSLHVEAAAVVQDQERTRLHYSITFLLLLYLLLADFTSKPKFHHLILAYMSGQFCNYRRPCPSCVKCPREMIIQQLSQQNMTLSVYLSLWLWKNVLNVCWIHRYTLHRVCLFDIQALSVCLCPHNDPGLGPRLATPSLDVTPPQKCRMV